MKYFNKTFIHFLLLGIAIFGLYWQTTNFDFVLDDRIVITHNNFVKKGIDGIAEIFGNDSMTGFLGKQPDLLAGGRYRPLSLAVFALGYELFGMDTFYFHLLNILFYLASILLLYITLSRLFNFSEKNKDSIKFDNKPYIFLAALLFAAHPVHTEAVANIKGLDEILAFLFGIGAFLFALIYFDKKKLLFMVISGISFLLSLFAKESTLPLLVAIPVSFYFFRNSSLKTVLRFFLLLLIPTVIYLLIRNGALGFLLNNNVNTTGIMNDPYIEASAGQKVGTILFTLLLYLKLLFFPHPLTHDYYPFHIEYMELYHPLSIVAFIVIASLIWVAVKGIKQRNKLAYIIFFFFITISIVSNVAINVGTFMNERFLFIPSFAFSVLIVFLFEKYIRDKKIKTAMFVIIAVLLVGFFYKSFGRIPDWKEIMSLNRVAVKVSKNSARSNCFYAISYYDEIIVEKDHEIKMEKIIESQKYIGRSLEIYPEYAEALKMKAAFAAEIYKIDKNEERLLDVFREVSAVRHVPFVDEFCAWLVHRADKNNMTNFYFDVGYNIFAVKKQNFNVEKNLLL